MKRRRTVPISFSKVMEATPKRKRVLPQWLLESSANYHATNKSNPPPTKRSKMSKEDQLLGPVRGKRPLKDISNYAADPKQRRREKDLARKRAARAKESYKEKAKRLNYQKESSCAFEVLLHHLISPVWIMCQNFEECKVHE